jgi:hypothetical protein
MCGSDPILVGAGDIAICSSSATNAAATARLIDGVISSNPSANVRVITMGDNSNESGTMAQYQNCYGPTWGRFKSRTSPSIGNHDSSGAANYYAYFGASAGPAGKGWHSYNLGGWHIVVLSAYGNAISTEQLTWLKNDLATDSSKCTLAYWHAPRFSTGGAHGDNSSVGVLWNALYADNAEVVVNGHDHQYERFAPLNPSGKPDANGMREFVVGTGGAGLRSGRNSSVASASSEFYLAGSNSTNLGVIKLTLHPASFDWQFLTIDGKVKDSGTGTCR